MGINVQLLSSLLVLNGTTKLTLQLAYPELLSADASDCCGRTAVVLRFTLCFLIM